MDSLIDVGVRALGGLFSPTLDPDTGFRLDSSDGGPDLSTASIGTAAPLGLLAQAAPSVGPRPAPQSIGLDEGFQRRMRDFLGFDVSGTDYFSFDRSGGLSGGALGESRAVERDGVTFQLAEVNTGALRDVTRALGLDGATAEAAVVAQEIAHKITNSHPSLVGKLNSQQTEIVGEGMSFEIGGETYLPMHLVIVGGLMHGERPLGGYDGYDRYDDITGPVVQQVLGGNEIFVSAEEFLRGFASFAAGRIQNGEPPTNHPNVLKDYLITQHGVEPGQADIISLQLTQALTEAYRDQSRSILDRALGQPTGAAGRQ